MLKTYNNRKLKDGKTIEKFVECAYRTLDNHKWIRENVPMKRSELHDMEIADATLKDFIDRITEDRDNLWFK